MPAINYFFCKSFERNGENEYTMPFVVSCESGQEDVYVKDILGGAQMDEDGVIWYEDGRAVTVADTIITPISKEEFNVLCKFIPTFTKR